MNFTTQQKQLIDSDGNAFFEACPGAGKTAAIVERFYKLTKLNQRKGIALLSFSRAAVEEVEKRCENNPESLESPNFVGTFDSFINRFIVSPVFSSQHDISTSFVDCWDNIDVSHIRLRPPNNWAKYSLDWFELNDEGNAVLREERIVGEMANATRSLGLHNRGALELQATNKIKGLFAKGIISSSESRRLMRHYISDPTTKNVVSTIAHRFSEIIVDEAQDCGESEILLLSELKRVGCSVVIIGDLDQSIYEFREATPALLRQSVNELELITHPRINVNRRSTKDICSIVNSLRTGRSIDVVSEEHASLNDRSVYLLSFTNSSDILEVMRERLGDDFNPNKCIVLSHAAKDAKECSGNSNTGGTSNSRVIKFAYSSMVATSNLATAKEKKSAISTIERILLGLIENVNVDSEPTERIMDDQGIDRRWIRDVALYVAISVKTSNTTPENYTQLLRDKTRNLSWPSDISIRSVNSYFRTPNESQWSALNTLENNEQRVDFPYSTVHGVKGQEFHSVVLVIPRSLRTDSSGKNAIDHWEDDTDGESKRVLYVGSSRAETILVLAVHENHVERVKRILASTNVAFNCL